MLVCYNKVMGGAAVLQIEQKNGGKKLAIWSGTKEGKWIVTGEKMTLTVGGGGGWNIQVLIRSLRPNVQFMFFTVFSPAGHVVTITEKKLNHHMETFSFLSESESSTLRLLPVSLCPLNMHLNFLRFSFFAV